MQPEATPPGNDERGRNVPLRINLALVLLLALWAYAKNAQVGDAILWLALGMIGLALLNLLALVVAAIAGKRAWVSGFALAMGLLLLIGLGTCGLLSLGT